MTHPFDERSPLPRRNVRPLELRVGPNRQRLQERLLRLVFVAERRVAQPDSEVRVDHLVDRRQPHRQRALVRRLRVVEVERVEQRRPPPEQRILQGSDRNRRLGHGHENREGQDHGYRAPYITPKLCQ